MANEIVKVIMYIGVVFGGAIFISLLGVGAMLVVDNSLEKRRNKK